MKKKFEIESCCKCNESKSILKEIYFYGKLSYLCLDCKNLEVSKSSLTQSKIYKIPSYKINYLQNKGHYEKKPTLFKPRIGKNIFAKKPEVFEKRIQKYADLLFKK